MLAGPTAQAGTSRVEAVTRAHPAAISDSAMGPHGDEPPAVSADGRFVAFTSRSRNLIAGYVPAPFSFSTDVYLFDSATGAMTLVSHAAGAPAQGAEDSSYAPVVSADGRYVAYLSWASDLVAGVTDDNFSPDVYLFDRLAGANRLVSRRAAATTTAAGRCSGAPLISSDGSRVAFASDARDLVTGQSDLGSTTDVFLFELATGGMRLVSRSTTGPASTTNVDAGLSGLSDNGRRVVFETASTNVVAGQLDLNGTQDVFLFDADSGATALISHVAGLPLTAGNGRSFDGRPSGDGSRVVFATDATDLVAGQTGGSFFASQVILTRVSTGVATLVSHALTSPTVAGNGDSERPEIDALGTSVAFESWASDLVAGSSLFGPNTYVFDRASAVNVIVSAAPGPAGIGGGLRGLSADGRYVAYESSGNPGGFSDDNNGSDVFLYDRSGGVTRLLSSRGGTTDTTANRRSEAAVLARGGLYAAFVTEATDGVGGVTDTNQAPDVLLSAGAGILVTRRDPAAAAHTAIDGGEPGPAAVSHDGRFVAFVSMSPDVVPGFTPAAPFTPSVYTFDRLTGVATLLSHPPGAPFTGADGHSPYISGDGRTVVFESRERLLTGQTGFGDQVYAWDRATNALTLVSAAAGLPLQGGNGSSTPKGVSADGRFVLLSTFATDLAAGVTDANFSYDLYLVDRQTGSADLVTHKAASPSETSASGHFGRARLAADGRFVAYTHVGTDLIAGQVDANSEVDAFLFDRLGGATTLVSHRANSATTTVNAASLDVDLSGDGAWVAFTTEATDVVAGQVSAAFDSNVFLFERASGANRMLSHVPGNPAQAGNSSSGEARVSRNGAWVAFASRASNLVPLVDDSNFSDDVFLWDLASEASTLVSHAAGLPMTAANSGSWQPAISADGGRVAFTSRASNLIPGQPSGFESDAFVWTRARNTTALVSRRFDAPTQDAGQTTEPTQIAGSGAAVLFSSDSDQLVPADMNARNDLFLYTTTAHVKGDLTDDLNTDLVLRNLTLPVHRVWALDGDLNRTAEIDIAPDQSSLAWRLVGIDDFNADQQSDLVFRNTDSGAVEFWMMDGATQQSTPVPLADPAPTLT
jgi:Tol biopolymer transport system component